MRKKKPSCNIISSVLHPFSLHAILYFSELSLNANSALLAGVSSEKICRFKLSEKLINNWSAPQQQKHNLAITLILLRPKLGCSHAWNACNIQQLSLRIYFKKNNYNITKSHHFGKAWLASQLSKQSLGWLSGNLFCRSLKLFRGIGLFSW